MLKPYFDLFLSFSKIGAVTFGGGYAMLPLMEKELCDKRQWVSQDEIIDYYAIGQSTPGIIAINVATVVGFKEKGFWGAFFASIGLITPSFFFIIIIAKILTNIDSYPLILKALKGINITVSIFLIHSLIKFWKKSIHDIWGILLFTICILGVFLLKLNPIYLVIFSSLSGIYLSSKKKKGDQ